MFRRAVDSRVAVTCFALGVAVCASPIARGQITVGGTGGNTTDSTAYSGTQSLTKIGTNTVTLSGNNSYTGGTVVNEGTLALTGNLANSASAPITVNNGGIFSIAKDNFMGGHAATVATPITINAGGQVTGGAYLNTLGALNLNGGTLTNTGGSAFWGNLAFLLKGTVTAAGDVTSTIGGPGTMMLGGDTVSTVTFDVRDGLADTDLLVSAVLDNGSGASWPTRQVSSLVKTGSGKMVLTANNIYTGATTISSGTLQVGNGGTTGALFSGAVTNNATLVINRSNAYTMANTISGTGLLVHSGNGTTTLSGVNSYSGGTLLNAGVLQVSSESQLGATNGAITLNGGQLVNNNADLSLNAARNVTLGGSGGYVQAGWNKLITIAGQISGSGGLGMVWDGGTLVLSGSNSYTGPTTIGTTGNAFYNGAGSLPTLRLGNANALPRAGVVVFGTNAQNSTATLDLYGYAATVAGLSGSSNARITNSAAGASTLTVAPSISTTTFAGVIANASGALSLVKSGSGTQILTGANTYSGATTISGGTLQIGNGGTTGLLGSGAVTNNASLTFNRSDAFTVGNAISGTGTVIKSGTGVVEFTVNNSHSGGLTVSAGSAWGGVSGAFGTGMITLGDVNSGTNNVAVYNSAGGQIITIANNITVSANGTGSVIIGGRATSGDVANLFSGAITLGRDVRLEAGSTLSRTTLSGSMSGAGGVTISQGRVTFEGTSKTYGGTTTVNSGAVLQLSGGEILPDAGALVINGSLYFGTGGSTETVRSLSGTGVIQAHPSVPGTYVLAVSPTDTGTFAGTIANGSGTVLLTKAGSGTQILTGANSYSGATTVSGGVLQIGNGGTTGSLGSGAVTNNASLTFNRSDTFTVGNAISGTGSVTQRGTGVVEFTANSSYSGGLTVAVGSAGGNASAAFGTGAVTLGDVSSGTNNVALYNSSTLSPSGQHLTIANNITVAPNGTGSVIIGGRGTSGDVANIFSGTIALGRDVRLEAANTTSRTTFSGAMTGAGGVTISQGRVTFEGTSKTYGGTTTVNSGAVLQLGNGEILPNAGALVINGTLYFGTGGSTETVGSLSGTGTVQAHPSVPGTYVLGVSNTATGTFAGTIANGSGIVAFTKAGSGTQILTGANTYSGTTTISEGTLQVGDGGTAGTLGTANVTNNGTLVINRSNAFTLSNLISGTGSLVHSGSGTTSLTGSNTYSGGTVINAGTLLVGGNNRLADAGAVTVNVGALDLGGFSDTVGTVTLAGGSIANGTLTGSSYAVQSGSVSAVLAGVGALTKSGSGTVTISGANSYTGGTTINAGVLATGAADRLAAAGALTVNAAGTFQMGGNQTLASIAGAGSINLGSFTLSTGSSSSTFAGSIAGDGGLTKIGPGTLTLSGSNPFTGDTAIQAGTLVLSSSTALPSDAVVTMQSSAVLTVNQRTFIGALDQGGGTVNGPGTLVSTLTLTESGLLNAVLADGPDFAAGILKRTSGTTTVGAVNTFTGSVKVQGGTLQLSGSGSFDPASSLVMNSGATLDLNGRSQTFSAVTGAGGTVALGSGVLTVNNASVKEFGGSITGSGGLVKQGVGNLILAGTSSYADATSVAAGRLSVNGVLGNSPIAVLAAAELGGSGSIGGPVSVASGGTLSPGNSIESLTTGSASFATGATFEYEVDSTDVNSLGTAADLLVVNGNLDIASGTLLALTDLASTPNPFIEDTTIFALINYSGTWNNGLFTYGSTVLTDGSRFMVGSQQWEIDYNRTLSAGLDNFTSDYVSGSFVAITAVPEPATSAMALAGLVCGGYSVWRRRNRA